jgi:hypothetical protein
MRVAEWKYWNPKLRILLKVWKRLFSVIPAQAGIQPFQVIRMLLDSPAYRQAGVFTGMTTSYDFKS